MNDDILSKSRSTSTMGYFALSAAYALQIALALRKNGPSLMFAIGEGLMASGHSFLLGSTSTAQLNDKFKQKGLLSLYNFLAIGVVALVLQFHTLFGN
mmetsp:Transcript_52841/g.53249  ORF Transcript_52841/g.53249 Transcript_52841/m.53249 type:complete len:98 (+) Transcript_52841:225-518(+)